VAFLLVYSHIVSRMAHRKAGGTSRKLRDSNPKYLGIKVADGQLAKEGSIIVRQRGTKFMPGDNTELGKDHTIFATSAGVVRFQDKRKNSFTGALIRRKLVTVEPVQSKQ
jgi:large subunit ribosomal protein L27